MFRKLIILLLTVLTFVFLAAWIASYPLRTSYLIRNSQLRKQLAPLRSLSQQQEWLWVFCARDGGFEVTRMDFGPLGLPLSNFAALGFGYRRFIGGAFDLTVPFWAPFVLFGVYPCVAVVRGPLRRRRRRRRNQCPACGYDLTGNTSGVCPECGSTIARTQPIAEAQSRAR